MWGWMRLQSAAFEIIPIATVNYSKIKCVELLICFEVLSWAITSSTNGNMGIWEFALGHATILTTM